MNRQPVRPGWRAGGIAALILLPMGIIFLTLGLVIWFSFRSDVLGQFYEGSIIFLAAFGSVGIILITLGLIFLVREVNRKRRAVRAFEGGYSVKAKITGFVRHGDVSVNGRSPYTIECQIYDRDTGKLHVYESRYIYFIPDENLIGKEVDVYLDRMDEKSYYVDIDAILPEVVFHR